MDFVTYSIVTGRRFRALTIIDAYFRKCPAIEVDTSLGGRRVVGEMERLAKPIENAFAESFYRRLRAECLNTNWFMNLKHAEDVIED